MENKGLIHLGDNMNQVTMADVEQWQQELVKAGIVTGRFFMITSNGAEPVSSHSLRRSHKRNHLKRRKGLIIRKKKSEFCI